MDKSWLELDNYFAAIRALAYRPGKIKHVHLQELVTRYDEQGRLPCERHRQHEKAMVTQVLDNVDQLCRLTVDAAMHRPVDMALAEPGVPLQVAVDTPTNGPRVSDQEFLLHNFGLDISGK